MTRPVPLARPLSPRAQAYAEAWRGWIARNKARLERQMVIGETI